MTSETIKGKTNEGSTTTSTVGTGSVSKSHVSALTRKWCLDASTQAGGNRRNTRESGKSSIVVSSKGNYEKTSGAGKATRKSA